MSSDWDGGLKRLVCKVPQDFVSWLIKGAVYVAQYSSELQLHGLDADILYEIIVDGVRCLLHIEFQTEGDETMARRVLEYNVLAHRRYGLKVYSYIIYLKPKGKAVASPYTWETCRGSEPSCFHFVAIKMWEYTATDLKATGLKGLIPLLPLTRGEPLDEILEDVVAELYPPQEPSDKELLLLAYGFLTYVYQDEQDQRKIKRRFAMLKDFLKESWGFQEIMQEGREEGLKEGREKGKEEGMKEGMKEGKREGKEEGLREGQKRAQEMMVVQQQRILMTFVEARFPDLFPLARERCSLLQDLAQLQNLILQVGLSRQTEEVRHLLLSIDQVPS